MKVSARNVLDARRQGVRDHEGTECNDRGRLSE
jgi:hypothetical protein